MRRNLRILVRLSVRAMLASVPLAATGAGAAPRTGPQVHVRPRAIADGQSVTFRGSGWTSGARVQIWVCDGSIVSRLPTTVNEAENLSFSGCSGPAFANGPRFSVTARLTQVQTYVAGCSSVCETAQFMCGPELGGCVVLATANNDAGGLELAATPIRFTTSHPSLTVTPARGVADGQSLTATVNGLAPYQSVGLIEC